MASSLLGNEGWTCEQMRLVCFLSTQPSARPALTQTQNSVVYLERADLRLFADGLGHGTVGFI